MQPPEPLIWKQRDACLLECAACGEEVPLSSADLHSCVGGR
jgi:hypothetical protein